MGKKSKSKKKILLNFLDTIVNEITLLNSEPMQNFLNVSSKLESRPQFNVIHQLDLTSNEMNQDNIAEY